MLITIKDETFAGKILGELELEFATERLTVRELITARVTQEVKRYNAKFPEYFKGLIEPNDAEKTLNGYRLKKYKKIDAEKQVYIALDAFHKNAYFVLIDDLQAESLEQEVELSEQTKVSFIKLTPLVGG